MAFTQPLLWISYILLVSTWFYMLHGFHLAGLAQVNHGHRPRRLVSPVERFSSREVRFLSLLNVERKQALDRQKKREAQKRPWIPYMIPRSRLTPILEE